MSSRIFKIIYIGSFLWIISICLTYAQTDNIAFRNLSSAEGLPVTSVTDVTQDAYGLIWIGSWNGVFRYDGLNFLKVAPDGRYLEADQKGGVWISKQGGDIAYYNPLQDTLFEYKILNSPRFTSVTADESGNIWIATNESIMKYNSDLDSFLIDPGQQPGRIYMLSSRGSGELFFIFRKGNESIKIGRRDPYGNYLYESPPIDLNDPQNREFFTESYSNYLMPYGSDGILMVNKNGWVFKKGQGGWIFHTLDDGERLKESSSAILDSEGNLWMNQVDAISKINIQTGESSLFKHNPANPNSILPLNSVGTGGELFIDRQGILWITRFSQGISQLNLYEGDFGLLKYENGEPVIDVLSAFELDDGSFYIGSRISHYGLLYFNSEGKLIKRYGSSSFNSPSGRTVCNELSHPFAWSMALTPDGSLWVGGGSPGPQRGGLSRIRPDSEKITRFKYDPDNENSLSGDWISRLLVDGRGQLWMASNKGIILMDPDTEIISRGIPNPPSIEGLDADNRTAYYPEMVLSSGNIIVRSWISGNHYIIDHKSLVVNSFGIERLADDRISYEYQDSIGRIWFYSKNQFGYLNDNQDEIAYSYNYKENGFPIQEINSFSIDDEGKIWLATDNGIILFDPVTEDYKHFGYKRGLQGNNYDSQVNYKGPSGKIYFAGNGGINIIDPDKININPFPPEMVFTNLEIDGEDISAGPESPLAKPVIMSEKVTLSPYSTMISIDFTAIHFAGFANNKYHYMLEGFDKNWRDGGNIGKATYTNLDPGKYNLRIKGSNWDNIWSDGTKSIQIVVLPPWWRTHLAYIVYFFTFIGLVFLAHKIQSKRVIAKEKEKSREKELEQAKKIEEAYFELKNTQTQLIQSEKMASLGELTAGIAHEIQNPLNFVNNFSEVSKELISEMNEELEKGEINEAKEIGKHIENNLEKINHHGHRASSIVEGMLGHSRSGDNTRELTNINALADEYLRLAYHGMRAKDKSFNADFKTYLDETLPEINIVPQDIGRVLLNLINNAFYASSSKAFAKEDKDYKPLVTVSTQKLDDRLEINVKDNGPGIPSGIKEKIFQPFFTTKPTGKGTGLGLSLSYDIIKAHGGEIKVESVEGEGTEFTIVLGLNTD